jgi:uracil-DNA glycosylase family 4
MPWDERQRLYLQAMGLRLWTAPGPASSRTDTRRQDAVPQEAARPAAGGPAAPKLEAAARPSARPAQATSSPPAAPAPGPLATATAKPTATPPATPPDRPRAVPDPARVSRIATLDWDGLAREVAACQACGLCQSRRQPVFGVGHHQARWLIVGEAPGEQEDLQGEPFVGPAGQLLDRMLAALDLTRSDQGDAPPARRVYIANTIKCRPPRNRNPEPAEMQSCEPFLQRQIGLLKPAIVLAMGRFAVQALLRTDLAIGQLRGQVLDWQGLPLIVTYHPAYLLRNPADKSRAWEDLCLAADAAAARLTHG